MVSTLSLVGWRLYCLFDYFLLSASVPAPLANANGVFPSNRAARGGGAEADELLVVEVAVNKSALFSAGWLSGNSLVHFSASRRRSVSGVRALLF